MTTTITKSRKEKLAELERSQAEHIANAEIVTAQRAGSFPPVSVRLSPPLLARLDRIARIENRKRGNLIQHILWEYVRARKD